jgi:membrane glycosyltransferase
MYECRIAALAILLGQKAVWNKSRHKEDHQEFKADLTDFTSLIQQSVYTAAVTIELHTRLKHVYRS